MNTSIRNYTDAELLARVKSLPSYNRAKGLPAYLFIAVRSKKDTPNVFDDKLYVYINGRFVMVCSMTTNPGGPILTGGWRDFSKLGAAVLKSDEIYYDAYLKSDGKAVRHHKDRMKCFRQVKDMLYYRDGNNDTKTDETGIQYKGNYSTNIHFNSYNLFTKTLNWIIGNWSAGCQVLNNSDQYNRLYDLIPFSQPITYVLLKEF